MRFISALLCLAALAALLCGCGKKDDGAVTLTGVFAYETVNIAGEYPASGMPKICRESGLIVSEAVQYTDKDDIIFIQAYDIENGDITYIRLPEDAVNNVDYTVDGAGNALLLCSGSGGSYSLALVRDNGIVWSRDLSDMMDLPSGMEDNHRILYYGGFWYAVIGKDVVVIDGSGNPAGHYVADSEFVTAFTADDGVHAVAKEIHLILNENGPSKGPSWTNVLPERGEVIGIAGQRFLTFSESGADVTDAVSGEKKQFVSWINSGLETYNSHNLYYVSDDLIYLYRIGEGASEMIKLTRTGDLVFDRGSTVVITCGDEFIGSLRGAALKFNNTQSKYRVVLDILGDDDYESALDLRLVRDGAGDIVMLPDNSDDGKYLDKKIFADLYDGAVDKGDLFDCVRKLYETDGRLDVVPRMFDVMGYSFSDPGIDPGAGWTMGDFLKKYDGGGILFDNEFMGLFSYEARSAWQANILWNGGFDRGMFIQYCERFIKMKAGNPNYRSYTRRGNIWLDGKESLFEFGRGGVGGVLGYIKSKAVWGEGAEVRFAGLPTPGGGRYYVEGKEKFGILNSAKCYDGAKEFLRYFMGVGYAAGIKSFASYFPSLRSAYYRIAENDSESVKYYFMPYDLSFNYASCGEYVSELNGVGGCCTANDKALHGEIAAFLDSAEPLPVYPRELIGIIEEEFSAVESGRDVSEIAGICENRVNLWFAEHDN